MERRDRRGAAWARGFGIATLLICVPLGCGSGDGSGEFSREFEKPAGEAAATGKGAPEKSQSRKDAIREDRERPAKATKKR